MRGELEIGQSVRLGVHMSGRAAALEASVIAHVGLLLIFDTPCPTFVAKPGMTIILEPLNQDGRRGWATLTDIQIHGAGLRITTTAPRWDNERGGRAERKACNIPVRITWTDLFGRAPQRTLGDMVDVSGTGARIRVRKTVPPNAKLTLEIFNDPNQDPLVCTAQVCRHISGNTSGGVEIGVRFDDSMDGMILVSQIGNRRLATVA